ncbi:DNA recombination protein RmuC [Mesoplasma seiffertii]|uniref:DNA recombination protein RmuC n=1 Tax=Mesoplasma seiffertii TaxID=28224 RepID=UPI00047A0AA8|nr:DNA recombination protein RmuC [Mesoplasma seiffertii]
MEKVLLITIIILLVACVGILLVFMVFKKGNGKVYGEGGIEKKDFEILQAKLSELNTKTSSELKEYINSLNNTSNEKLSTFERGLKEDIAKSLLNNSQGLNSVETEVKKWILEQNKSTQDKLDLSSKEVRMLLGQVKEQSAPIADVKDRVMKLDNLLSQNNKAGKSGEYLLERLFENFSGINKNTNLLFERQYTLNKKVDDKKLIVDLFIKGDGVKFRNIPVDAKFPFNAFKELFDHEENTNGYNEKVKQFIADVKKRITETSKYVSEEDNTVYAIMFVPSEGVFSFINANSDLIDFAFKNKVIIAGPSTLVAILQSVDKYMELFDNIAQADKKIQMLDKTIKYLDNYDEQMEKFFNSVESLINNYENVKVKDKSLRSQYNKLIKE